MNSIRIQKLQNEIVKKYIKQSGGITYMVTTLKKPPKLTLSQIFEGKPKKNSKAVKKKK